MKNNSLLILRDTSFFSQRCYIFLFSNKIGFLEKKMHRLCFISLAFCLLMTSGCVNRIGDFTIASTKNIDIKKSLHVVDTRYRVAGKDRKHIIIIFPTGVPNLKEAMDNAEEKAPSCVGLSNVTIKNGWWYIPYIYGTEWYEVEGNPVFEATDGIPENPPYASPR